MNAILTRDLRIIIMELCPCNYQGHPMHSSRNSQSYTASLAKERKKQKMNINLHSTNLKRYWWLTPKRLKNITPGDCYMPSTMQQVKLTPRVLCKMCVYDCGRQPCGKMAQTFTKIPQYARGKEKIPFRSQVIGVLRKPTTLSLEGRKTANECVI